MNHKSEHEIDMVPVFRAPDGMTAEMVRGLLESEGLTVYLKSLQAPMYDGIMVMGEGYWGDVLVHQDQVEQAKLLIQAYEQKSK